MVYSGVDTERTIVGLGGSVENVLGSIGASPASSHSATPNLLRALRRESEPAGGSTRASVHRDEEWELAAVEIATGQIDGPQQVVEFVAKRLLWGEAKGHWGGRGKRVILGTPLYVALHD